MDKIFTNVSDLLNAVKRLNANPVAIVPSYTEGFAANHHSFFFNLDCEECYCCFYFYNDYEAFYKDVAQSISTLDLTDGADDQFFDYNPSCFESLLFAAQQLPALDKANLHHQLLHQLLQAIQHYKNWVANEDGNDEMLDQYESYIKNIENNNLDGLEGYELYNEIKQSL